MKVVKVRGPRQNLRKRNRPAGSSSANGLNGLQQLKPAYPGQPTLQIWIPGTPEVLSTTVTSGQIAEVTTLSNALIPSLATKWQSWLEGRIVKYRIKITNFSSTNPGLLNHWFDEESSATPTAALAISAKAKRFGASVIGTHTIEFVVTDPTQLNYSALGIATTHGFYKLFSNNADFGSSVVATQYCLKEVECLTQFRGFV